MNKKFLIVLLSLLTFNVIKASNTQPAIFEDFKICYVSEDGTWGVSSFNGSIKILNTSSLETTAYIAEKENVYYDIGKGNVLTKDGSKLVGKVDIMEEDISVGKKTKKFFPAVYINEEYTILNVPNPEYNNIANGISADGYRICGTVSVTNDLNKTIQRPAIWEQQLDGSYGHCQLLPYPQTDWLGRCPQSITASVISEDGKFIVGQVTDAEGNLTTLIAYTLTRDGNWAYYQPFLKEMSNPNNIDIPDYPGARPQCPVLTDFITPEEYAEYERDHEWWEIWSESHGYSNEWPEPKLEDYLSAEDIEKYNVALEENKVLYNEWRPKYDVWFEAYSKCKKAATSLEPCVLFMSQDFKTIVSAYSIVVETGNESMLRKQYAPCIFNLESNTMSKLSTDLNILPSCVSANGTIFGSVRVDYQNLRTMEALVVLPNSEMCIPLIEYVQNCNAPRLYQWITENLYRDLKSSDYVKNVRGEWVKAQYNHKDMNFTGVPVCSADLSMIFTYMNNVFDKYNESEVFSYMLPMDEFSDKDIIVAPIEGNIYVHKGGIIELDGNFSRICIYDMEGRIMADLIPVDRIINIGIESGIYIVKAESPNGTKIVKATF